MIEKMTNLPAHVLGFKLSGEITKDDYENVVFPAVKKMADELNEINMVMVLNTKVKEFTAAAWIDDAILGLKNITKWNRVAIVSDEFIVKGATMFMDKVIPGHYKAFSHSKEAGAIEWAGQKSA